MTAESEPRFIIVTPAFNEAAYLDKTIESVVSQTRKPIHWLIVDDGSTDETSEKIRKAESKYPWIHGYRRTKDPTQTYFASNVYAIADGVKRTESLDYDFLAILDADILLPNDYYEQVLDRFGKDPMLGVASGVYLNLVNGKLQRVLNDRRSTPKAIQVFRRSCYEQIGGYVPMRDGGEDTCACIMARLHGWKSWSFPELKAVHCRPTGMGSAKGILRVRFRQGLCEYGLATHPLFMAVKSLRRCILESPRIVGGILRMAGYIWGFLRHEPCQMPQEAASFIRRDQLSRVFRFNRVSEDNQVTTGAV